MSQAVGGMARSRRVKGTASARTEGARRATGVSADGAACQRSFKFPPPAVIEISPTPLVENNDETSAGGRCGQAVCGLSKARWARLRVHGAGSVHGPPVAHVPAVVGLTTPDFNLSFSRYESPRMLSVVA